jgi:hypothetical protein
MGKLIEVFDIIMGLSSVGIVVDRGITKALINGTYVSAVRPTDGDFFTLFVGEHGDTMQVYTSCVVYTLPGSEEKAFVSFLEEKGLIGPQLNGIQYSLQDFCKPSKWTQCPDYYESKDCSKQRIGVLDGGVGIWLGNGCYDDEIEIKYLDGKIVIIAPSVHHLCRISSIDHLLRKIEISKGGTYHLMS